MVTLEQLEDKYGLIMVRKEICDLLGISLSTFKRWEDKGKIKALPMYEKPKRYSTENVYKMIKGESDVK